MRNNLLVILFIGLGFQLWGQEVINEAHMKYEVTEVKSSDPNTDAMLQMMKGSTIDVYFKNGKQRMDMDMMGGMMKMSTYMNIEDEKGNAMYMDMMGKKIRVDMTDEELKKYQNQNEELNEKPVIEKDMNDTKEISGFECFKVTIKYEGNGGIDLIAYVTDQIDSPESVMQNASDVDLGGVPLEYQISNPEFNMTYTTVEFNRDVESAIFNRPDGYEPMTFEQFVQSMGAMGGGMGQ